MKLVIRSKGLHMPYTFRKVIVDVKASIKIGVTWPLTDNETLLAKN